MIFFGVLHVFNNALLVLLVVKHFEHWDQQLIMFLSWMWKGCLRLITKTKLYFCRNVTSELPFWFHWLYIQNFRTTMNVISNSSKIKMPIKFCLHYNSYSTCLIKRFFSPSCEGELTNLSLGLKIDASGFYWICLYMKIVVSKFIHLDPYRLKNFKQHPIAFC